MTFTKIGIMSIGEMGFHWAKLLKGHGVEVFTYDKDRGEVSRKRSENAGSRRVRKHVVGINRADFWKIANPAGAGRVFAVFSAGVPDRFSVHEKH